MTLVHNVHFGKVVFSTRRTIKLRYMIDQTRLLKSVLRFEVVIDITRGYGVFPNDLMLSPRLRSKIYSDILFLFQFFCCFFLSPNNYNSMLQYLTFPLSLYSRFFIQFYSSLYIRNFSWKEFRGYLPYYSQKGKHVME